MKTLECRLLMEYVDKDKSRKWAHEVIESFLDERLAEYGIDPGDNLYALFRADTHRKEKFTSRLLRDSRNRCCYCMRDITGTTLEHVIPQSVRSKEEYFTVESNLDKDNIMLECDYLNNPKRVPPFPHTLAYENIIPSCLGCIPTGTSKCCNNFRGNEFIYPLMFRRNISKEIIYRTDGTVSWTKEPESTLIPTVERLGLNCAELRMIRKIWYYLSTHNLSCEDCNRVPAIEILLDAMGDSSEREILQNFKNPDYWNVVKKYTYFNDKSRFTVQ